MSYEPTTKTVPADGPHLDAFGRVRFSEPTTIFDSKQLHDNDPLRWAQKLTGAGAAAHVPARVSSELAVTSGTDSAIRQTKQRFVYQPGRSLLVMMTGVMARTTAAAGATSRAGLFDGNDGLFFELEDTTWSVVRRSGGVDVERVAQSSWNIDTMDGAGPSGITLDGTKAQIFVIDLQWLGVGRVRMCVNIGGITLGVHEFKHANVLDIVYMLNPNLPVRYELLSTGGARTMDHICVSVSGEGIVSPAGVAKSIDRGIATITAPSAGNFVPIISMRLKSTHLNAAVLPIAINVLSPTAAEFLWRLVLNPTISGADAVSWTPVGDSAVEYDISRDNTNLVSAGTVIASDYGGGGPSANAPASPGQNLDLQMRLGADVDGVRDEYVLCAAPLTGTNETLIGKIGFRELL
jgi:hypothetical protein